MLRRFLTLGLLSALVFVLTGAACLACSDLLSKEQTSHACCKRHGKTPVTHKSCAAAPVTPSLAKSAASVVPAISTGATPEAIAAAIPSVVLRLAPPGFHPYSPPDLCLLHSILTI